MSCDTCQDCGCDNITLPTGNTGATGATGATGSNGADGADGVAVLHNDTTQLTTTSSTIALFGASKSYTLPANTLATNGSKLRLTALFTTTGQALESDSTAYVYINGGTFTSKTLPFQVVYYKGGNVFLAVELEITRVSDTDLFIQAFTKRSDTTAGKVLGAYSFYEKTLTVPSLTSSALDIDLRGKTTNTTTFNCEQLTIVNYVK